MFEYRRVLIGSLAWHCRPRCPCCQRQRWQRRRRRYWDGHPKNRGCGEEWRTLTQVICAVINLSYVQVVSSAHYKSDREAVHFGYFLSLFGIEVTGSEMVSFLHVNHVFVFIHKTCPFYRLSCAGFLGIARQGMICILLSRFLLCCNPRKRGQHA